MFASVLRLFSRHASLGPKAQDVAPRVGVGSPEFLRMLERLQVPWSRAARGSSLGEKPSRRDGGGYEFFGHRAYDPADDFRTVDWTVYARTGRLFTRTRERTESTAVSVFLDSSASMGVPALRWQRACELTLALAFVALRQGDTFRIMCGGGGEVSTSRMWRGRTRWSEVARYLAGLPWPGGSQPWRDVVGRLPRDARSGGALVWISDFLGAEDPSPIVEALGRRWGELVLWQILAGEEIHPAWRGYQVWQDAETGEVREGEVTEEVVRQSQLQLRQRVEAVRQAALRHGGRHEVVSLLEPVEESLGPVLQRWCAQA